MERQVTLPIGDSQPPCKQAFYSLLFSSQPVSVVSLHW